MIGRNAAEWQAAGALALALLLALPGCSSGDKPAAAKPEPVEISEADQRINADTDPLNGGGAPQAAGAAPTESGAESRPVDRVTLAGGLVIEDLREGQGPLLMSGEGLTVTVHYVGRLAGEEGVEGLVFDSTYARGKPITLELDRLIRGWRQGLPGMRIGGLRRLTIPPELAYGDAGYLNVPGGATVVYEVLLLGFSE